MAFAGQPTGFFSEQNINALKNDPTVLFSKANTCQIKALLSKKDFDAFNENMSQVSTLDNDEPGYVSISGAVRGLYTIMEGFFRIGPSGKIWIAYLSDNKVHYFTNDAQTLNSPPKIIQDWSSRFKDAKWENKLVTFKEAKC